MKPLELRAWDKESNHWVVAVAMMIHTSGRLIDVPPHIELTEFTGMLDKGGKKIYDGDILLYRFPSGKGQRIYTAKIGYVSCDIDDYGETFSYTGVHFLEDGSNKPISGYWFPSVDDLEIIGNIYEHPELLRKG